MIRKTLGNNLKEHSKKGEKFLLGCILRAKEKKTKKENSPSACDLFQFNIQLSMHTEI